MTSTIPRLSDSRDTLNEPLNFSVRPHNLNQALPLCSLLMEAINFSLDFLNGIQSYNSKVTCPLRFLKHLFLAGI